MTLIYYLTLFAAVDRDATNGLMAMGVVIGIVVLVVGKCLMAGLLNHYRIPPAGNALVRDGHGGSVVVIGSGIYVNPMLHDFVQFPLAPLRIDLRESKLDSLPAKSRQLPNIFQVAIDRAPEMILRAVQKLPSRTPLLSEDMILAEYERLLTHESEDASQDSPANRFIDGVEQALNTMGLTIIACRRQ